MPDLESFEAGGSDDDEEEDEDDDDEPCSPNSCWRHQAVTVRVRIKRATGLPAHLSNFVFCQYSIWGDDPTVVAPLLDGEGDDDGEYDDEDVFVDRRRRGARGTPRSVASSDAALGGATYKFNHCMDFTIPLSEEFVEHCLGKAYPQI
jgi:kinesin family protein 13